MPCEANPISRALCLCFCDYFKRLFGKKTDDEVWDDISPRVMKAANAIKNNLKDDDLKGAIWELKGVPTGSTT